MVDDTLALPHGDLSSERTCKRRRLVRRWLVDWKRRHHHDHAIPFPSYKLRNSAVALRAQHFLLAIRDTYVSRNLGPESGADGYFLREWKQLERFQGQS